MRASLLQGLREGLEVDLTGVQHMLTLRRLVSNTDVRHVSELARAPPSETWREDLADCALGPGCPVSHAELRSAYGSKWEGCVVDDILLVISLSLSLAATGMNNVRNEEFTMDVARVLRVPAGSFMRIEAGHLLFVVDAGPTHHIPLQSAKSYDKLGYVYALATSLMVGEVTNTGRAIELIQRVPSHPPAWGWLWRQLGLLLFAPSTCFAVFGGSWRDSCVCLSVNLILLPFSATCKRLPPLKNIEPLLVPLVIGVALPLVYMRILHIDWTEHCHMGAAALGLMHIRLPGVEFVRGVYQCFRGHLLDGGSRLVGSYVQVLWLALAVMVGWQVFAGGFEDGEGKVTVTPCLPTPAFSYADQEPWWARKTAVFAVLVLCLFPLLQIRAADIILVLLHCLGYRIVLHYLPLAFTRLPSQVVTVITVVVATSSANIFQILTGVLQVVAVEPIITTLAPGGTALAVAFKMGALREGDPFMELGVSILFELVSVATSIGMGMYLTEEFFKPFHRWQHARRAKVTGALERSTKLTKMKTMAVMRNRLVFPSPETL